MLEFNAYKNEVPDKSKKLGSVVAKTVTDRIKRRNKEIKQALDEEKASESDSMNSDDSGEEKHNKVFDSEQASQPG